MTIKRKTSNGFTLIEMLVAATIMAVLTAIGIVSFSIANQKARDAKRKADLEQARSALEIYRSDNTGYPVDAVTGNLGTIGSGSLATYMTSSTLVDPKDTAPFQYTYTSDGVTYSICAYLEPSPGTQYCVYSP